MWPLSHGCWIYYYLCNRWFSLGPPVSSTSKIDRHDITEILVSTAKNILFLKSYLCYNIPNTTIYHQLDTGYGMYKVQSGAVMPLEFEKRLPFIYSFSMTPIYHTITGDLFQKNTNRSIFHLIIYSIIIEYITY